jgi:hypothetical protein
MPGTTNFPTALDTFPDIAAADAENDPGKEHDVVHNNEMAALAALQVKVGIDGSADAASLDHRIAQLETVSVITVHGDGTTTTVDNADPLNPIVASQPTLDAAKAYTDAAIAALPPSGGTNLAKVRRLNLAGGL